MTSIYIFGYQICSIYALGLKGQVEQFEIENYSTQHPKASRGKVLKFSGPA